MCGIVGFAMRDTMVPMEIMRQWTKSLDYRGPDGYGFLLTSPKQGILEINEKIKTFKCKNSFNGSIGLGQTRLSINDLSDRGFQPLSNKEKTCFITHGGEIYN